MGEKTIAELLRGKRERTIAERIGIADKTPGEAALLVTELSMMRSYGCGRKTRREICDAIRSSSDAANVFDHRNREAWAEKAEPKKPDPLALARTSVRSAVRTCKDIDALREAEALLRRATV